MWSTPRRRSDASHAVPRVLGARVDAPRLALLAHDAELRREDDVVAAVGDRGADKLLVLAGAVHVGGVEERDAELGGAVDRADRLLVVRGAVELRHAHAAEAEGGDVEAVAERAVVHVEAPG